MSHRYGWRKSPPDTRDLVANTATLTIADEVDPRGELPAVYDQGQLGSCTSNAVAAALQYDRILDGHPSTARPSRLFLYFCERKIEGSLGQGDTGAYGRDGFKAAHNYGVPTEHDWPYEIDRFEDVPPDVIWQHATRHKLTKPYVAVSRSISQFKQVLSNRQTIAFGFTVYESFESSEVEQSGIVPMPGPDEAELGGHEVLLVGYLADHPDHALCRNSWGTSWGIDGYFLMPWHYLLESDLSSDFRTIRRPAGV